MNLARNIGIIIFLLCSFPGQGKEVTPAIEKGSLLVAHPSMPDPRFAQTVIVILDYGPQGALGLVVNNPIGQAPRAALQEKENDKILGNDLVTLYRGGPVEPRAIFALHGAEIRNENSDEISPGLYLSNGPEFLRRLGGNESLSGNYRLCLGYSAWGSGQLEAEFKRENSWILLPPDGELVLSDPKTLWQRAIARWAIDL